MQNAFRLWDLRTQQPCAIPDAPFVLALGNFDGVHAAHHVLLTRAVRRAASYPLSRKVYSAAWLFDPPSSDFFHARGQHLTTLEEKLKLFAACGLDYAFLADFSALRDLSPSAFIKLLRHQAKAIHAVCGFHFHFGKDGAGDASLLTNALGTGSVDVLPPIYAPVDGSETVISSTAIRTALIQGRLDIAGRLLGRPYRLSSPVCHGKHLGRTLGFPTINQEFPPSKCIPASGVYATRCHVGSDTYIGVSNVGCRPTTDGLNSHVNCETHLIDCDLDLYGQTVCVDFLHRLRGEATFDGVEQLRDAIARDIQNTKALLE